MLVYQKYIFILGLFFIGKSYAQEFLCIPAQYLKNAFTFNAYYQIVLEQNGDDALLQRLEKHSDFCPHFQNTKDPFFTSHIHKAVLCNNMVVFERLLDYEVPIYQHEVECNNENDIRFGGFHTNSFICKLIRYSNEFSLKCIQKIAERNTQFIHQELDYSGDTPLHRAARYACYNCAVYLLGQGAQPNTYNKKKQTVLRYLLEHLQPSGCINYVVVSPYSNACTKKIYYERIIAIIILLKSCGAYVTQYDRNLVESKFNGAIEVCNAILDALGTKVSYESCAIV